MKRDGSDVVQRDLYWDPDDEETAELVVIREGARRARKASTQAIPSSFAVDFAQLVKTAAGAKGPNQGPQGKGAGRRNSAVPAVEAPKSANGEPDSGKQSRERLGPGTKRRADDAEADVDLEGETPPVWKLNATLREKPGSRQLPVLCSWHVWSWRQGIQSQAGSEMGSANSLVFRVRFPGDVDQWWSVQLLGPNFGLHLE